MQKYKIICFRDRDQPYGLLSRSAVDTAGSGIIRIMVGCMVCQKITSTTSKKKINNNEKLQFVVSALASKSRLGIV